MLPQRLRWLLPALIVSWMHLQLGAALPAHDERSSHVSVNTFDPSAITSTMIRQDYNKRGHPPDGKNDTQSSQKLVASPAGLLRPDKFQFYTYNDKGDMITRQMTVQEIQGLIAAGGADHIAMDRQEPQKADDVLTGGKKVMDVVQKVQNVLKSALDKPLILTGTVPKIPEHANVEWSNILPSILSGEADAISPSSSESSHKFTTEETATGSASNIGTNATSNDAKKPAMQTNAYGGFTNNMEHGERPQYIHHPQQVPAAGAFSEKPMIPVPVITLTEQKLTTLQSVITESPVFQMLSVIPVEATDSNHHQQDQSQPTQTEEASQTEQFIELALSEVPETLTSLHSMNSDAYFANFPKQTTANLDDKGGMGLPTATYSTTSSISTVSSAVDIKQTVAHKGVDEATTSKISSSSPSNANYAVAENKNNMKPSEDPSFALGVTKESQVNGIQSDEKLISQTNTATSKPLSHAPTAPKPEEMSNEPVLLSHLLSTFSSVSKIETSTVPILSHTNRLNEATSKVTEKLSVNSVTPTYTKDHLRPTEIQSSVSMEPLPTQLIDSFSSVMSQISEAKPPVLSLSSTSGGLPEMTMMNINHDQRYNMSDDSAKNTLTSVNNRYDTLTAHGANEENIERVAVGSQTYPTVAVKLPPLDVATRTTSYSTIKSTTTHRPTSMGMDKVSIVKAGMNKISLKPSVSSTTEIMSNGMVINNIAMASSTSNVKSTDTTTSSPMWVQLEKIQNVSVESLTESSATFGTATATNTMLQKHTPGGATSPEEILSVTSSILDTTKTPSTSASMDLNVSLKRPMPTSEYFDDTLMNLNLSDPVSAIDQILNIVPLPSSTPTVEPISLPNDTSDIVTSDLASGLIAGFLSTSQKSPFEEINGNQVTKITSSARPTVSTVGATKPTEFIENVTQIHKGTVTLNVSADRPKESIKYTQTSTQRTLVTSPIKSSTVGSSTHTKASTVTSGNKNVLTTKPTKLPNSSEKINDSTKVSSSSLLGNSANGNYVSKGNTERSTTAMGAITASPERLSTTNSDVRPLYTNKTQLHVTSNQNKKDNREKIKTTEAPIIRTDVGSELSSPVKVTSMDSAGGNNTRNMNSSVHTESSSKTEMSSEKNQFSANTLATQSVAVHQQHHNFSSHVTSSVNGSKSELHGSHKHHSNVTTGTGISNITFNTANLSTEYSTSSRPVFAQNTNRVSNATTLDKNKGTTSPMSMTTSSHTTTNNRTTVTSRPMQSNKTDTLIYNISTSSPSSSPSSSSGQVSAHTDRPIIKVVTQAPSGNVSGNHEKPSRPSLANGTKPSNPINKTSNQRDKIVSPQHTTQIMPIESTGTSGSTQTNGEFNSTESKPASLKHSENSPKPDVVRPQSPMPNVPTRPSALKPTVSYKPLEKSNVSKPEADTDTEEKWTLISQQTPPAMTKLPKPPSKPPKPLRKPPSSHVSGSSNPDENGNVRIPGPDTTAYQQDDPPQTIPQPVLPLDVSQSASGLDVTVKHTSTDIVNFAKLCNELAFNYWVATNKGLSTARSLALSPFGMTSLLAMIFLGARGPTSDQMNEVLGLDDVTTFNPHLVFQNITDTVGLARGQGIANAAFVRELFADKMKVRKLMPFYKEQAQQFYEGLVAEVNFATISDLVRRRTNLLIRKQTGGRIKDFVKTNTVPLRSPLAALSANVFQTDCNTTLTSSVGRDGELYFAVSPAVRQRRLVPVPATTWRSGVLAGYEPSIDATAVALGGSDKLVSTIFLLPGQQGHTAPGDTLDRLEQRLVKSAFRDGTWNKLLKVLTSRSGLELQVPKFSHRSVVNATAALKRMGLDELFSGNADFKGINGVGHRLHLADVLQMNLFSTCGDENILSGRHHVETYPASPLRSIRRRVEDIDGDSDDVTEDDVLRHSGVSSQKDHTGSLHADRSHTGRFRREKRQLSTTSERPRLKLDRPFLYFVRHNPSGIILHMGRFNPRLLP
ncbi:serine-rich adhesin for platelets [Odontomachus brunneus]|uniref:serine-rich adhesin for platelets n=1 Tax=Odontomachus brunneus TaxID=486640 RepID=UPI0013F20829|nr:serine-rich adhesin for platelets [Odontomachus brunneus]